ncbi:Hpt domain-containing protein [Yunchengibacter salinarum]|uniref:Hpt domain-containing protein n=1 Tax=Yunchengibacter salinarum TaxID=3133399 RepID=UPI0035B65B95
MAKQDGVIVRFYRFQNRLKEKTAGLSPGRGSIDPEALEKAQETLDKLAEDYPDWVNNLITKLHEKHSRCVDTPENRKEFFEEIAHIAHDMKGQGGTFGYPLITAFAESLYGFTNGRREPDDDEVELVKSHVDAMRAVIKNRVSGDGGDVGKQLTAGLNRAIEKYKK